MGSIPTIILCVLLITFTTGCSPVQDIIPAEVESLHWFLSPSGDKLLYDSNTTTKTNQAFVRFLATDQDVTIVDCPRFSWLDDDKVYCYDYHDHQYFPSVVVGNISSNTTDFQKISVKTVTVEQVKLDTLLKQAKSIYRLQPSLTGPDSLLVLGTENTNQYYHLTEIEDLDGVLKNYNYTSIPLYGMMGGIPSKKVYSPNQAYYFVLGDSLRVYNAINDRLIAEAKPPFNYKSYFQIGGSYPNKSGGWAADSSGVYFQIFHTVGFIGHPVIRPIQKLSVPGKS